MSKRYSNTPVNVPRRRRDPALRTLAAVGAALALSFAVKLIYDPPGGGGPAANVRGTAEEAGKTVGAQQSVSGSIQDGVGAATAGVIDQDAAADDTDQVIEDTGNAD